MAIRQVGSRRIVVDGVVYRWRIPPKPTYRQECHEFPLLVFVWREDNPHCVMTFHGGMRPDAVYGPADIVTPRRMARSIRAALDPGWGADRPYELVPGEPAVF